MKIAPPKISYDPQSRILSIKLSRAASVDSDVHGNVVVDYDAHRIPVRLDIMDCSLGEFRHAVPVRRHVRTRRAARQRTAA
ncbi:MAG: DUF2283 domain-containing protein [bacterium]|nr:DUF2283 domain-containing protein [bacterium]